MTDFIKVRQNYVIARKSIIAKMNATKGNLMILVASGLIKKDEREALQNIIDAYENFRLIYNKPKNPIK